MYKRPLVRNYTVGCYSLSRMAAINSIRSGLSERNGISNLYIGSPVPSQLEGDKGYLTPVAYYEDLDKTFGFPEELEKVIFLDVERGFLPFNVRRVALEEQAGIVITTPSIKDDFYDEGILFSQELLGLMEHASESGVQIVGITPSVKSLYGREGSSVDMIECTIMGYLLEHPSIKNFLVINKESMDKLSPYFLPGDDIAWGDQAKAKDILNGRVLKKH